MPPPQIKAPDTFFGEAEFSSDVWNALLKRRTRVIECRTGKYSLKLINQYSLTSSSRYNDTYVEGILYKVSNALKMLSRIGTLTSHAKSSRVNPDPLPMIPLRNSIEKFYGDMVTKIDACCKIEMDIDQLEIHLEDVLQHLNNVYSLYSPLLTQKEADISRISSSIDVQNSTIVHFKGEVEAVWHNFFYKIFTCSDSSHLNLPIWKWIFDELLEILPIYLDKITEFTNIRIDAENDKIILFDKSREEAVYFRFLWSDQLTILVNRAFNDRARLFGKKNNATTVSKPWSKFFQDTLSAFAKDNYGLKKLVEIKPIVMNSLLEKSCQQYTNQFSKLILDELNYRNRLLSRLKELEGIYSMQAFVDQVNRLILDDVTSTHRNSVIQAIKNSLNSPLLPETTSKYWSIVVFSKFDQENPYGFKVTSKSAWPVSLVITQSFLDNLALSLKMMNRLFYQYMYFRSRTVSCVLNVSKGLTIRFPRRTQNFVLSFRQLLYRLFNCLVKKVGSDIRELQEIAQSSTNFNDLEANIGRWSEKMLQFATNSHSMKAIEELSNCAQNFIECFRQINAEQEELSDADVDQSNVSQVPDLDVLTHGIREEFCLSCVGLNLNTLEPSNFEFATFEKELSLIVAHITENKFLQL